MTQQPTPTSPVETPEIETPTANQQPAPAPQAPEPAPQPVKPEETAEYWKNRYSESSREAQLLVEQNKLKEQQIQQLTQPHDPTDNELKNAYPEWDSMMPSEQRLARENFSLKKAQARTESTIAELAAETRWGKDLKQLTKKPEFAALKGREDDFEAYVFQPNHKGIPTETLARSFLFGATAPQAPAPAAPANPPAPTGERSSGGPAPEGKKKLSLEEAKVLRESNFEEYRRQVQAGNIEEDFS